MELLEKISTLVDGVVYTRPTFHDNPNGGHVYMCLFCNESVEVGGDKYVCMHEMKHSNDCIYPLAVALHKEL